MDTEPGEGWADAVSRILRMGRRNPESNRILSKAKRDKEHSGDEESDSDQSDDHERQKKKTDENYITSRLKPAPQSDALVENELKCIATRGVVHLFNAVKTVNPRSDKKKKTKKKTKKKSKKRLRKRHG